MMSMTAACVHRMLCSNLCAQDVYCDLPPPCCTAWWELHFYICGLLSPGRQVARAAQTDRVFLLYNLKDVMLPEGYRTSFSVKQ